VRSPTCETNFWRLMSDFIRILIVDDSAFARKVLREILATNPALDVVGTARDGEEALNLTAELEPDLVLCDLLMPKLDGVGYVRRQMRKKPLPILIVSAAAQDAAEVIEALSAGAVDVVQKPSALATEDLRAIRDELVNKIKATVHAPVRGWEPEEVAQLPAAKVAPPSGKVSVVVLGISTGGPQALRRMMPLLPADLPVPMAIVLHMPVGYTALYAEKLNELCRLEIKEAQEGDLVEPGRVLLAPAGRHLTFRRNAAGSVVAQLSMQPLDKIHRPSVDVLFQSAAQVFQERVLAVVMTGMGDDGLEGAAWVKAQGGRVITEAEKSCVIYGMPRSVAEAGLSDEAISLDDMAQAITSRL
jgi:two-component system, chemotaxis family, protein-glutamate methylesterase/glutaminase